MNKGEKRDVAMNINTFLNLGKLDPVLTMLLIICVIREEQLVFTKQNIVFKKCCLIHI